MTKVLICVPMVDSSLRGELFAYLWKLQSLSLTGQIPFVFDLYPLRECRPVEFARNVCVRNFLNSPCDVLWFLDADNIPGDEAHKVLDGNHDISIGPCPMFIIAGSGKPVLTPNIFTSIGESNIGELWQPGMPVKAGGTANMAIKRSVLEDKRLWLDDKGSVFKRDYDVDGNVKGGEDIDFCRRACDLGHTLGAEMDATCDHAKTYGLSFIVETILRQIGENKAKEQA